MDVIILVFMCMFLAGATCWIAGYNSGIQEKR